MGGIVSAYVKIVASTIALHTPAPLSLTFSEEKGDTPSKLKHMYVLSRF